MADLVRLTHQRGEDADALRARVSDLEATLEGRRAEIRRLRADLAAFEIRYRGEVGRLHEELDRLERAIDDAEIGETARRAGNAANQAAAPAPEDRRDEAPRDTSDAVRKLFRELAKVIHPDLAPDGHARDRRHALMVEANRAYEMGDEERLRSILQAWESGPEAVEGDDDDAVRERLARRIAQIEEHLVAHAAELAQLRESALWKLKAMVDAAAARGEDLIADMRRRLTRDLMVARNRLDAIQWRP